MVLYLSYRSLLVKIKREFVNELNTSCGSLPRTLNTYPFSRNGTHVWISQLFMNNTKIMGKSFLKYTHFVLMSTDIETSYRYENRHTAISTATSSMFLLPNQEAPTITEIRTSLRGLQGNHCLPL